MNSDGNDARSVRLPSSAVLTIPHLAIRDGQLRSVLSLGLNDRISERHTVMPAAGGRAPPVLLADRTS